MEDFEKDLNDKLSKIESILDRLEAKIMTENDEQEHKKGYTDVFLDLSAYICNVVGFPDYISNYKK